MRACYCSVQLAGFVGMQQYVGLSTRQMAKLFTRALPDILLAEAVSHSLTHTGVRAGIVHLCIHAIAGHGTASVPCWWANLDDLSVHHWRPVSHITAYCATLVLQVAMCDL